MNTCLHIVRDDVYLKDKEFIFIYREVLKIFLRINPIDYTSTSQCIARMILPRHLNVIFSVTCHVMKVISYIDKLVFQDFIQVFTEQKKMKEFTTLLFLTALIFLVR